MFDYEAVLSDHEYHFGQYWDVHFLSLAKDRFLDLQMVRQAARSPRFSMEPWMANGEVLL